MELNRRHAIQVLTASSLGIYCCGCRSAPVTGRRQLVFIPESQEIALGLEAYRKTVTPENLSDRAHWSNLVSRVGQRIAAVTNRPDFQWEFQTIAGPEQNAFCLPGGKVAVYEGIMPVCQSEAGLAVVMAHEIAHAIARHGGERMSQSAAVNAGKDVFHRVVNQRVPDKSELLLQAYGVATQYGVILPYNRKQESEADHIGIMLMAKAGYDPLEAPEFWTRFSQLGASGAQPEFLSTHPSSARRSSDLEQLLPEALAEYKQCREQLGSGEPISLT